MTTVIGGLLFLSRSGTQYMTVPFELAPKVGIEPTINALKAPALDTKLLGKMGSKPLFKVMTNDANLTSLSYNSVVRKRITPHR